MSFQKTILAVDDDPNVLEVIKARLSSAGFRVLKADGGIAALNILKKKPVDLMISDMKMPGMGGMDLFTDVQSLKPGLPVIFLTAYGTIPEAVHAVKAGAVDYLAKPFDGLDLVNKLNVIFDKVSIDTMSKIDPRTDEDFCWGESPAMQALYDLVKRVAVSNVNVLIFGESGVGKERIASIIHRIGSRRERPFVIVDCGSTPTGLLESELFGHVKGSFTNAVSDKKGLIEAADQGTLFLDEVGNISPEMQLRLLRFLENRKIRRIGNLQEISVDCRVISATNSDLLEDIKTGRFRQDLYYRLHVITLKIPSLLERKEDIPNLAEYFMEKYCKAHDVPTVKLPSKTVEWLCNYPWPGNVRELKNALEAGIVLCRDRVLRPCDIQLTGLFKETRASLQENEPLSLEESERNAILRALEQTGGVQKHAAKLLGISRRSINYKVKKFGIDAKKMQSSRKFT